MKYCNIKLGDRLRWIGDNPTCFHTREEVEVKQNDRGDLFVPCKCGKHFLFPMLDAHKEIPEFEPV